MGPSIFVLLGAVLVVFVVAAGAVRRRTRRPRASTEQLALPEHIQETLKDELDDARRTVAADGKARWVYCSPNADGTYAVATVESRLDCPTWTEVLWHVEPDRAPIRIPS